MKGRGCDDHGLSRLVAISSAGPARLRAELSPTLAVKDLHALQHTTGWRCHGQPDIPRPPITLPVRRRDHQPNHGIFVVDIDRHVLKRSDLPRAVSDPDHPLVDNRRRYIADEVRSRMPLPTHGHRVGAGRHPFSSAPKNPAPEHAETPDHAAARPPSHSTTRTPLAVPRRALPFHHVDSDASGPEVFHVARRKNVSHLSLHWPGPTPAVPHPPWDSHHGARIRAR